MFGMKKVVSLATILTLLFAGSVFLNGRLATAAQKAQQPVAKSKAPVEAPLTEKELTKLIKHNRNNLQKVATEVENRGVDFEFTPDIEKRLTKAGAVEKLITYMKQFTPSARAARKASGVPSHVGAEEAKAYNKLKDDKDPDVLISDAEGFAQQFPKSGLLTYVYALEATAYQQKNNADAVVKYGQESLDLDPKNLMSLLMVSEVLPQPQMLNSVSDAEKEKRLNTAEKDAQMALQEINQLPKQPKESNAAYEKRKGQIAAGAYASLGMVHLERSNMALEGPDMDELAKAEQNFKTAIAKSENPNPADLYRLGEVYVGERKLSDAIGAFSKAGQLAQGTIIERLADQQVQALKKAQQSQRSTTAKP